jgi:hypothetical protein
MKSKIFLLLLFILSFGVTYSFAQEDKTEQSIREQIQTEKIAFFTEKIGLTLSEAERFWPVYNEYWDKKNELIADRKEKMNAYLNHPESFSRQELEELANDYVNYRMEKAKLLKEYHTKFQEVLPVEKVMRLYLADYDFKSYLLNKIKKKSQDNN